MKKILLSWTMLGVSFWGFSISDTLYPTDTLVYPSMLESSNIVTSWEAGFCKLDSGKVKEFYAPCYTVQYLNHYESTMKLCPDDITETLGFGNFNDEITLVDGDLFAAMEADGSNIINDDDNFSVNYQNLSTGETRNSNAVPGDKSEKHCVLAELDPDMYQEFKILMGPIDRVSPSYFGFAAPIGVFKNGTVIEGEPPSSNGSVSTGSIITLDRCG